MERIFENLGSQNRKFSESMDDDPYAFEVRSLINDSVDYEDSELAPTRERNQKYYYGLEPALIPDEEDEHLDPEDMPQQSSIVSTDVRDTVMTVMPELIRIFTSSENVLNFKANSESHVQLARQATDYIKYKFWEENEGFILLHSVFKDALTVRAGITTWWTDNSYEPFESTFMNVTVDQVSAMMTQASSMNPEIVSHSPVGVDGTIAEITIKGVKSKPTLKVTSVPPEEFRISRRAKSVHTADCVGWERPVRASELIAMGFDYDLVMENTFAQPEYSEERDMRNPGGDTFDVLNDLVNFGEWFIRIDSDGDGINELHKICTIGDNYEIADDYITDHPNFAVWCVDPRPHTAIGDSLAELTMDIQEIKTYLLRNSLDSMTDVLNPRTVVNETLTNISDATNPDRGALIRTKGNVREAVATLTNEFVGAAGFEVFNMMDGIRQSRTGMSEASKGIDPKAFQSTNLAGIDAVVTGAQARIELIARILAETGMKDTFRGMLRESIRSNNQEEIIEIRGQFVPVNPSLFDPNMRCVVNPQLGRGTDQTRLQALTGVRDMQVAIIEKYGINNPLVSVEEFRNTLADILSLVNIKDVSRYFKEITPEIMEQIMSAPTEPDPATVLAKAELEKVKKDMVLGTAKDVREEQRLRMDDDFRRDKLAVDSYLEIASIFKDLETARQDRQTIGSMNEPG